MAFSTDLVAKLQLPWDPAAAEAAPASPADGAAGSPSRAAHRTHPLKVNAMVVGGNPLNLPLRLCGPSGGRSQEGAGPSQPRASGAAAAGGRSGASGICFSDDRMAMFVSGLYFRPVELLQDVTEPDGRVQKVGTRGLGCTLVC